MKLFTPEQERLSWLNVSDWYVRLWKHLLLEKLNTRWGYALALAIALAVSWVIGTQDTTVAWYVLTGVVLAPVLVSSFLYPRAGVMTLLFMAFWVSLIKRLAEDAPIGGIVDIWLIAIAAGIFFRQITLKDWSPLSHWLSIPFGLWFLYCLLEVLNPWAYADLSWLFAFRSVAGWMLLYPMGLLLFTRLKHMVWLHRLWIGMVTLVAIYGLWQWIMGPGDQEFQWILASQDRFDMLFSGAGYKVFSIMPDPSTLGFLCGMTAVVTAIIGWKPGANLQRIMVTGGLVGIMLLATLATRSRVAAVLPVIGLLFYAFISLRKEALIASGAVMVLWLGFLLIPTEQVEWQRLQRIANPKNIVGAEFRDQDQSWVQPFILDHPIGAGLGKTGPISQRFAPDVWLSQYPPESAYVRLALETGYLGLFLYLALMASIMIVGIKGLLRTRSPRIRVLMEAWLTFTFLIVVASFARQVTTQLPIGLMFMLVPALLVNMSRMESSQTA